MKIIESVYCYISHKLCRLRPSFYRVLGINIGHHCIIEKNVILKKQYGGNIQIGNNCIISTGAQLLTHGGSIKIGNSTTINPMCVIYGQGGTEIGDNVRIAAHTVIVPSNHIFTDINQPIYKQGLSKKGIIIKDDVWIGAGVKVLDGVTIGEGCVIGANSVVTHSLEPYGVYVGVPAKLIKSRL